MRKNKGDKSMEKIVDERVVQGTRSVMAKNFRGTMLMLAGLLGLKTIGLLFGLAWHVLLPEACGIFGGAAVWAVWMSVRGLWGETDERVLSEREACLSSAWTVAHCVALLVCTNLMIMDRANQIFYVLTGLAMTLIMYATMGRMTQRGLYTGKQGRTPWLRLLCVTCIALVTAPVLMWLMGTVRQETYPTWMYILVEAIMLVSCLLGGMLANAMIKKSNANAEKQLAESEDTDEE